MDGGVVGPEVARSRPLPGSRWADPRPPRPRCPAMVLTMATAALSLIDEHPGITAFIAPQRQSVIGVLMVARARSLRLPQDLSLIGMLSESMSGLATPTLTAIDFPAD